MDLQLINTFTNIEKGFNVAGSIPIVSFISGAVRAVAGKIQALVGAIMATIGLISYSMTQEFKWKELVNDGNELIVHGALNFFRGVGEATLSASTLIGNVFLLIPNLMKDDKFSPYFAYGSFNRQVEVIEFV